MGDPCQCDTPAAKVDMVVPNNVTWQDAFQFDDEDDTSWNFTGQSFIMEIKGDPNDTAPLLELTSAAGEIVVDSETLRVLHLNVPYTAIRAALPVGEYVYDFVMFDASPTPVRVLLMYGDICVQNGITET
jgi:hypothetical protein